MGCVAPGWSKIGNWPLSFASATRYGAGGSGCVLGGAVTPAGGGTVSTNGSVPSDGGRFGTVVGVSSVPNVPTSFGAVVGETGAATVLTSPVPRVARNTASRTTTTMPATIAMRVRRSGAGPFAG